MPDNIKILAEEKEIVFRKNWKDSTLRTHKLNGRLKNLWSFSINYQYRIIFEMVGENECHFHTVGMHDVYE